MPLSDTLFHMSECMHSVYADLNELYSLAWLATNLPLSYTLLKAFHIPTSGGYDHEILEASQYIRNH
jgi:hypothetical protein